MAWKRLLVYATATFVAAGSLAAQIVPVPGTGCCPPPTTGIACPCPLGVLAIDASGTVGPPKPGSLLNVRCPPPTPLVRCCDPTMPSAIFVGNCVSPGLPLPPGLGCTTGCTLDCLPAVTLPGPGATFPLAFPVGFTFCLQCACIVFDPVTGVLCVNVSEKTNVTIVPPPC